VSIRAITDSDFDAAIGVAGVVVVHFTASWCAPCDRAAPVVAELAGDLRPRRGYAGAALVVADIDAAPHAAMAADVRGVPCLVAFRDGARVAGLKGFYPRDKLRAWVDGVLKGEG
jgi:thioredoxin-like negative regulator of GroEL